MNTANTAAETPDAVLGSPEGSSRNVAAAVMRFVAANAPGRSVDHVRTQTVSVADDQVVTVTYAAKIDYKKFFRSSLATYLRVAAIEDNLRFVRDIGLGRTRFPAARMVRELPLLSGRPQIGDERDSKKAKTNSN